MLGLLSFHFPHPSASHRPARSLTARPPSGAYRPNQTPPACPGLVRHLPLLPFLPGPRTVPSHSASPSTAWDKPRNQDATVSPHRAASSGQRTPPPPHPGFSTQLTKSATSPPAFSLPSPARGFPRPWLPLPPNRLKTRGYRPVPHPPHPPGLRSSPPLLPPRCHLPPSGSGGGGGGAGRAGAAARAALSPGGPGPGPAAAQRLPPAAAAPSHSRRHT